MLAALLSNELTTKTTVPQVLEIYSRVRQPLATEVARRSRLNGSTFRSAHSLGQITMPTLPPRSYRGSRSRYKTTLSGPSRQKRAWIWNGP